MYGPVVHAEVRLSGTAPQIGYWPMPTISLLETLVGLQQVDKLIGVISRVTPQTGGRSQISALDAADKNFSV